MNTTLATEPVATSRRSVRNSIATLFVTVALFLVAMIGAGPAQAQIIGGQGIWGYNAPANVTCRYLNAWNQIRTEVAPPTAYAYNRWAGAGNDAQWVRYRLFYVDNQTGASLGASGYSTFALAYDNSPARWSGGVTVQVFDSRKSIRVETRIEFYNSQTGAYQGFLAHTADRYYYYEGNVTNGFGPMNACGMIY